MSDVVDWSSVAATGLALLAVLTSLRQQHEARKQLAADRFDRDVEDVERRLDRVANAVVELGEAASASFSSPIELNRYEIAQGKLEAALASLKPVGRRLPRCESLLAMHAQQAISQVRPAIAEVAAETTRVLLIGPPGRPEIITGSLLETPPSPADWRPSDEDLRPGPRPERGRFWKRGELPAREG